MWLDIAHTPNKQKQVLSGKETPRTYPKRFEAPKSKNVVLERRPNERHYFRPTFAEAWKSPAVRCPDRHVEGNADVAGNRDVE